MNKYIGLYLRLSQEEEGDGESNSITSQRQIIWDFLANVPEFAGLTVNEFVDDGYSGTNFDRPAVKLLLEAVRKGEIHCIIVKDFSRFGRQYLEVSKLIEQVFPYFGVRFIAVNDYYDSNKHKGTTAAIDVPVRNMINAMYSKDISNKVKSAKRTQLQNGVFGGAFAPYGYKKDSSDRHRLCIDEPAAAIIRYIFSLSGEGYSAFNIADKLNSEDVLPPSLYKKQNSSKLAANDSARALWTKGIIANILRDERYTGTLVGGRSETIMVGSGKKRKKPKNEWIRIPGAIPAIVTQEVWNELAAKRQSFTKSSKPNSSRILYKKVRCGYCRLIMQYVSRATSPYYLCDTARYTDKYGCRRERFRAHQIDEAVRVVVQSRLSVTKDMGTRMQTGKKTVTLSLEPTKAAPAKRNGEIKRLQLYKRQLYERYKTGSLEKDAFMSERESIETAIKAIHVAQQSNYACAKYQMTPTLPDEVTHALVEAVYIFGTDRIKIKLSFRDELAVDCLSLTQSGPVAPAGPVGARIV